MMDDDDEYNSRKRGSSSSRGGNEGGLKRRDRDTMSYEDGEEDEDYNDIVMPYGLDQDNLQSSTMKNLTEQRVNQVMQGKTKVSLLDRHRVDQDKKKKRDDDETARVFEDFVASFDGNQRGGGGSRQSKPMSFVRAGTIQADSEDDSGAGSGVGSFSSASMPPKSSNAPLKPSIFESNSKQGLPIQSSSSSSSSSIAQQPPKKKGKRLEIDALKEELRQKQEEREREKSSRDFRDTKDNNNSRDGNNNNNNRDNYRDNNYSGGRDNNNRDNRDNYRSNNNRDRNDNNNRDSRDNHNRDNCRDNNYGGGRDNYDNRNSSRSGDRDRDNDNYGRNDNRDNNRGGFRNNYNNNRGDRNDRDDRDGDNRDNNRGGGFRNNYNNNNNNRDRNDHRDNYNNRDGGGGRDNYDNRNRDGYNNNRGGDRNDRDGGNYRDNYNNRDGGSSGGNYRDNHHNHHNRNDNYNRGGDRDNYNNNRGDNYNNRDGGERFRNRDNNYRDNNNNNQDHDEDVSTFTSLFLRTLPSTVKEDDLKEPFSQYGSIVSLKVIEPKNPHAPHCAIIQYTNHDDADQARISLEGKQIHGRELRIAWAKNQSTHNQKLQEKLEQQKQQLQQKDKKNNDKKQNNKQSFNNDSNLQKIHIRIPVDEAQKNIIDKLAYFVSKEGYLFEQEIAEKEKDNPMYKFLFDSKADEYHYYTWKSYTSFSGDETKPVQIIKDGIMYIPPSFGNNDGDNDDNDSIDQPQQQQDDSDDDRDYSDRDRDRSTSIDRDDNRDYNDRDRDRGNDRDRNNNDRDRNRNRGGDDYDEKRNERSKEARYQMKKEIGRNERHQFEDMLEFITTSREVIMDVMGFSIVNSEFSNDIVEMILDPAYQTPKSNVPKLYLISDILCNCTVAVHNVSSYRALFESKLPYFFQDLSNQLKSITGRVSALNFKDQVMKVLGYWEHISLYPKSFLMGLKFTFLNYKQLESIGNNNESTTSMVVDDIKLDELSRQCKRNGLVRGGGLEEMETRIKLYNNYVEEEQKREPTIQLSDQDLAKIDADVEEYKNRLLLSKNVDHNSLTQSLSQYRETLIQNMTTRSTNQSNKRNDH